MIVLTGAGSKTGRNADLRDLIFFLSVLVRFSGTSPCPSDIPLPAGEGNRIDQSEVG